MSLHQLERPFAPSRGHDDDERGDSGVVRRIARSVVAVWHWLDREDNDAPTPQPYVAGTTRLARELLTPTILGFVATVLIFAGATQPGSPFTLKSVPGAWFFGIPSPSLVQGLTPAPSQSLFIGIVAVYGGMLLLVRAWLDVVRVTTRHPGTPTRALVPVFAAWVAPLLVVAPLFSRDAYSYAAQGEMMAHGINPYHYGPGLLGATPFSTLVDPLWQNVSSPYGPVFLGLGALVVEATRHNDLLAVEGMRLLALVGVALFAAALPSLARSFGRDGSTAFALAALNPLVLLHLVGGAHNDALMIGLLVAGYALARRGHPILGIICCAIGAEVKFPALIGAVYIGWEWLGAGRTPRERLRPVATALLIALAVMTFLSQVIGLGWGWVGGLTNPDAVRSWLDPATGIGLVLAHVVQGIGLGDHTKALIALVRGSAVLVGLALVVVLLFRSEKMGSLRAIGWSLVVVVVLGPVVQPWYLAWGFVLLAPVALRRDKRILIWASVISCFLGLPGGRVLVDEISAANPFLVGGACAVLVGLTFVLVGPKLRKLVAKREPEQLTASA